MVSKHTMGIIGFGGMAQYHHKILAADVENLSVNGVYDPREERNALAAERGLKIYGSPEELLADSEIDLVLVATPNDLHKPYVIQSLRAGKNVICEKPAALSSAEFSEMCAAAKEEGLLLTVHQNRRQDADYLAVRDIYHSGVIGDVFKLELRLHGSHGIPEGWRREKEHGGGMIYDWGVHMLDALCMLTDMKIKRVYCRTTHITNETVDDGFTIDLTMEDGSDFLCEIGTNNFYELPHWYMIGRNGTAVLNGWETKNGKIIYSVGTDESDVVPVKTASGISKTMAPRREDTIKTLPFPKHETDIHGFYRNVVATLDGKEEPAVKQSEVMRVLRLIEACFLSDKTGKTVDFE